MDNTFDRMFYDNGNFIGGIDETGVSDIAGPLIAACVVLPKIDLHRDDLRIFEVNDSKKIPSKYIKQHAEIVWQVALAIGIGSVTPDEIAFYGKHTAIKVAMLRSITACRRTTSKRKILPDFLLIDGELPLPTSIPHKGIRDGDCKSLCVASASVIAKVYRDELMMQLHEQHPHYHWDSNRGHPCQQHFDGIDKNGLIYGVHRMSYWPISPNAKYGSDKNMWTIRRKKWKQTSLEKEALRLEELNLKEKSKKDSTTLIPSMEAKPQKT